MPVKRKALNQCCFNDGPPILRWSKIKPTLFVEREVYAGLLCTALAPLYILDANLRKQVTSI